MSAGLVVTGLNKAFGGIVVARDLNISLPPGARTALIGPNGAGKTTFSNLITGILAPTSGEIRLDGKDIGGLREAEPREGGDRQDLPDNHSFQGTDGQGEHSTSHPGKGKQDLQVVGFGPVPGAISKRRSKRQLEAFDLSYGRRPTGRRTCLRPAAAG